MIQPSIFPNNIICAYSDRSFGELAPFRDETSSTGSIELNDNRNTFLHKVHIQGEQTVQVRQLHTDKIAVVDKKNDIEESLVDADAMITNQKEVALSIYTSDCLPVFFYDSVAQVVAAVHAGWRGVYLEIIPKTIKKMVKGCSSDPKDILIWIGPHISESQYGFPIELFDTEPANNYFEEMGGLRKEENTFYTDLGKIAEKQLLAVGIMPEHIETSNVCTYESGNLFSYRKGDRTNNMGVIMMK